MHKRARFIVIIALMLFVIGSGIYSDNSVNGLQDYSNSYDDSSYIWNDLNERTIVKTLSESADNNSESVILSLDAILPAEEARILGYEFYAAYPEFSLAYSPRIVLQGYSKDADFSTGYRMTKISAYSGDARYEELKASTSGIIRLLQAAPDDIKVWVVSRWIASVCDYTSDVTNMWDECLYGCLVKGTATCLGFSEGFYYMMKRLHVPCRIVANDNHAWNEVLIDGRWETLDITKLL